MSLLIKLLCSSKLCNRKFHKTPSVFGDTTKLTSKEITSVLRANEFTKDFADENCAISFYDTNQLASNSPIEDAKSEGRCIHDKSFLFGVFDGHSGPYCAQVAAKCIFDYICSGLVPHHILQQQCDSLMKGEDVHLVEKYNERFDLIPDLKTLYREAFLDYIKNISLQKETEKNMMEVFENSVLAFDKSISDGALRENGSLNAVSVALSGAVSCMVRIDGPDLYIANIGDSRAVLGRMSRNNSMVASQLTVDHNADNVAEVHRIRQEHPPSEGDTVIRAGRLLGQLAPLRALGDVTYKWKAEDLQKVIGQATPTWYRTPPYLSAKPEIFHHRLTSRDKFLIIASDGLWDEVTPLGAVQLVSNHIRGAKVLDPWRPEDPNMILREINKILVQRKKYFSLKPDDRNSATHLIRKALSGSGGGKKEHDRLSQILTIPQDVVRLYRDDITVIIIHFNHEYLNSVS